MALLRSIAWSRLLGAFVTVSVGLALVVVAVRADGSEASSIRLDDGAVWVSNEQAGRVGRLNVRIDELDLAVEAGSGELLQEERAVVFSSRTGGLQKADVITAGVASAGELPAEFYRLGGGIGVAYDPETGFVWIGSSAELVGSEYPEAPDAQVAPGSLVHVTRGEEPYGAGRGRIIVVDEEGLYELALDENLVPVRAVDEGAVSDGAGGDGEAVAVADDVDLPDAAGDDSEVAPPPPIAEPERTRLDAPFSAMVGVSSVGHDPVVLLDDGAVLVGEREPVRVGGDAVMLQQAGPAAEELLVASDEGLFEVALDDGDVTRLSSSGGDDPAAPVRVANCVYGAWAGDEPSLVKRCGDNVLHDGTLLPAASPGSRLVFRVNGQNVALNQPANGGVWIDRDGDLAKVGNWDPADPQTEDTDDEPTDGEGERTVERTCVTGGGAVPTAGDDELGARPRQTILDVLANDDDANCEPIAVASVTPELGPWGELTIINDGQHVLLSPSDEWKEEASESAQSISFEYTVIDGGRNESAPASVSVSMQARSVLDRAPALRQRSNGTDREMVTVVEEGRSIEHDVLADWFDPDGDQLRVIDAVVEGFGQVSVVGDTTVRYEANGVPPGRQLVQVTVSDGVESAVEPLEVTIQPTGSPLPPVTADDFLTIAQGTTGTVYPLANDSDPNEDELALRPLWNQANSSEDEPAAEDQPDAAESGYGARVVRDDGVEIEGLVPGRYALRYEASDGDGVASGTILLRVLDSSDDSAPIAVPDRVYVRTGRVANVDVLANDVDLDGDLLAVSEVSVGASGADGEVIRASVVDRRLVQIEVLPTSDGSVPAPMVVSYIVSDGRESERASDSAADETSAASLRSQGTLTVIVEPSQDRPPIPQPDRAAVRVGDVVAVPVLRNDVDPDGDELSLVSIDDDTAAEVEETGAGVLWVEGRNVMFKAGADARERYTVAYTMQAGEKTESSVVEFEVIEPFSEELGNNQSPEPPDLELRAVRGGRVRLQVPTSNVDRDGDSVVLVDRFDQAGDASSENRVSIDSESPDTIIFEASVDSPARDSFTYWVRDGFGLSGTATVDVVVIDDTGAPPVAHDDIERGRPGRTISIATLANDTSPQDRQLSLAEMPFFDLEGVPTATPVNAGAVKIVDQTDPADHGFIDVEVPSVDDGPLSEVYRISDGPGSAAATIRVTPDPATPNRPPVARIDVIEVADIVQTERGPEARVNVVENDHDPDDAEWVPILSLPASQRARIDSDSAAAEVVVAIEELPRTVVYRVTDADDGAGVGQIRVPGTQNHPPVLSDAGEAWESRRVQAGSGATLEFVLADIVTDPDGDEPVLLTAQALTTVQALGEVDRVDESGRRFVYTPPEVLPETKEVDIEFEVTDRPLLPPDDQLAPTCNCRAVLKVRLVVEANAPEEGELEGSPPRVLTAGSILVPQLDEVASVDLADLVVDDDDDELTFTVDRPARLEVDLVGADDSTLEVVSRLGGDQRLAIGSRIPIRYTVSDGIHDPVRGTVTATIIETNRPRPAAGEFPVFEAERDEPLQLPNLVDAADNPFSNRPLVLSSASADGAATVVCDEVSNCTFTTSAVGTFTVTYGLTDDAGRTVFGTLTVVAKGRPTAPGVPRVESVGDGVVNITWDAADPQGSPITAYTVLVVGNDGTTAERNFPATGGRVDGLTNTVGYRFSVFATNELGDGEVSESSSIGIPDRIPSPPINLRFEDYGDGTLRLAWDPPADRADYSDIIDYEVTIGGTNVTTGGATRFEATGLTNGADYEFDVRARNSADANEGWGNAATSTTTERPSRFPDPPTGVTAANSGDGGSPRLTVTWSPPGFDGGRPIQNYEVCRYGPGAPVCKSSGSGETSTEFDAVRNTTFTFDVVAINSDKNRPESDISVRSEPVTAVDNPDPPVIGSVVSPTSRELRVTLAGTPPNNSGCSQQNIEYRLDGGQWQQGSLTGHTFTGLTNGTTYQVVARAVLPTTCGTPSNGGRYASVVSNAVSGTPFGPLQQPTMNAIVNQFESVVRFDWDANRLDPSDPDYDGRSSWNASLSGPCAGQNPLGGTFEIDIGYFSQDQCSITVSADGVASKFDVAVGVTTHPETWEVRLTFTGASYTTCAFPPVTSATVVDSSFLFGVQLLPQTMSFGVIPAIDGWVDFSVETTEIVFEQRRATSTVRVEFDRGAFQVSPGSLTYSSNHTAYSSPLISCASRLDFSVEASSS